jgi:hypothetical protein
MVVQKVSELSDANMRTLAKAHGLNPDEYDFNARDDHRHRVERDQLAKDITEQMGEDEKINIGRAAERSEGEGTFASKDTTSASKAERAAKMFPRLRGPVDEFGNAKAAGGAPDNEEGVGGLERWQGKNPIEKPSTRPQQERVNLPNEGKAQPFQAENTSWDEQVKAARKAVNQSKAQASKSTVGTEEAAKSDTEHFANAKKELGDKASISDVAKRAQELKDEAKAKPEFSMIKDADGKPDRLEITSGGEPVGHLKIEEEVPGTWTVKDAVVKDPQKGIGTAAYLQLFDEARKAGVKAVESDISTTKGGAGLWKSLLRDYPEAVKEDNGQYSADPHSNVLAKLGEKKSKFNKIVP